MSEELPNRIEPEAKSYDKNENQNYENWGKRTIVLIGILIILIFLMSCFLGPMTDKASFIVTSILAVLLLGVVIIQAVIYSGQLTAMNRQWNAMLDGLEQSKTASKATSDALRLQANEQRAWLFLKPTNELRPSKGHQRLDWTICNRGKTTAQVVTAQVKSIAGPTMDLFISEGGEPHYGNTVINFQSVPLQPEGLLNLYSFYEFSDIPDNPLGTGFDDGVIEEIQAGSIELVAFGFVKYIDGSGEHESRFCFRWEPVIGEFRIYLLAPAPYHHCT